MPGDKSEKKLNMLFFHSIGYQVLKGQLRGLDSKDSKTEIMWIIMLGLIVMSL